MKDFSYNTSDKLQKILNNIDEKRIKILTALISPKDELRLRWEASIDRISASFSLAGTAVAKQEIINLFSKEDFRKINKSLAEITYYKKGFDLIVMEWLANRKNLSLKTIVNLFGIIFKRVKFPASEEKIRHVLEFIQSSKEHSVILSGIFLVQFLALSSRGVNENKFSRLLAYLFLYKGGYDFRGLLKIEPGLVKDKDNFREIIESSIKSGNLTLWLEYYAQKIDEALDEVLKDIESNHFHLDAPAKNFVLNDRQKEILTFLEIPEKTITNRNVQKLFEVSQITASRDLARLASLGLIFVHGKGRSVYYTKV